MRTILSLIALPALLFFSSCSAQDPFRLDGIKNAHTVTVRVDGDCPMCEKTIEKAAYVKGEAVADWDVDAKTARITIDITRTDIDAVLQRIAHAGYDNERYLAPDAAYTALPGCCQYERTFKRPPHHAPSTAPVQDDAHHHHIAEEGTGQEVAEPLAPVLTGYFALKDALVASDATKAKDAAARMNEAVRGVDMGALDHEVHTVWMEVMGSLTSTSAAIANAKGLEAQRKAFRELTALMTRLVKASSTSTPVYLDHCPMYEGGADWLSRDKAIKNPFYGSQMMTCGSVKETIIR